MRVFITGGTGSLGQALLRFFERANVVEDVTVYSRDEVKQSELRRAHPDVRFMLGDVRDYDRLLMAMRDHEAVIHAAAYKQVPSAEANVNEAIATNVMGSLNVARAAIYNNINYVVGLSTDKACQPVNAYGETKALMEKLFQQADEWASTIFTLVRYGNVLGSRGSVVPLFRKQLKEQQRITLTNPDMTRFWMTLDQAVEVVWQAVYASSAVHDGAIVVPQCGASTMEILAEAVARVEGYKAGSYEVDVIGTRPGEKRHEQLIHENESLHTIRPVRDCPYFQILPATRMPKEPPPPFEYRSDTAPQISVSELVDMLANGANDA